MAAHSTQTPQQGFFRRNRKKITGISLAALAAAGGLAWAIFTYYADVSGDITAGEARQVSTTWSNPLVGYSMNVDGCSVDIRDEPTGGGDSLYVQIDGALPDAECQLSATLTLSSDANQDFKVVGYGSQLPEGWTVTFDGWQGNNATQRVLSPGESTRVELNFSAPENPPGGQVPAGSIGPGGVKLQPVPTP